MRRVAGTLHVVGRDAIVVFSNRHGLDLTAKRVDRSADDELVRVVEGDRHVRRQGRIVEGTDIALGRSVAPRTALDRLAQRAAIILGRHAGLPFGQARKLGGERAPHDAFARGGLEEALARLVAVAGLVEVVLILLGPVADRWRTLTRHHPHGPAQTIKVRHLIVVLRPEIILGVRIHAHLVRDMHPRRSRQHPAGCVRHANLTDLIRPRFL
mmetsp:Transcript_55144/g.165190  ORF Transcript_55144/g.165190 Transcript_55144/m.165190 type:complete len:212 (+) Transcript_55144:1302-1937(+)